MPLSAGGLPLTMPASNSNDSILQQMVDIALVNEISKTPNKTLRAEMEVLLDLADQNVRVGATETTRGTQLESLGFKWLDALHIACAESGRADILLTTDDRMLRRAKHFRLQLRVPVENLIHG